MKTKKNLCQRIVSDRYPIKTILTQKDLDTIHLIIENDDDIPDQKTKILGIDIVDIPKIQVGDILFYEKKYLHEFDVIRDHKNQIISSGFTNKKSFLYKIDFENNEVIEYEKEKIIMPYSIIESEIELIIANRYFPKAEKDDVLIFDNKRGVFLSTLEEFTSDYKILE